jgi:iron(III) transport system substrate-binding protein
MRNTFFALLSALLLTFTLSACQPGESADSELVVYSGRSEVLVDSLVDMYRQQTGETVDVNVRYGSDAQLLAALEEEGDQSPADVFWANTTGALGQATDAGLLTTLPDSILALPTRFAPESGQWTPITTRFRVLAYNPQQVDADDLPDSVADLPELNQFEGRIGWTPAYSSFQDFVTALRIVEGDETARAWLEGMQALNPNAYPSNTPMIRALAAGEIDIALTNHYYVLRLTYGDAKVDDPTTVTPEASVETHYFAQDDIGNLALVTGAGVLQTSDQPEQAQDFLRFLLSEQAQGFAANTLNEYPLIEGAETPAYLMPLGDAQQLSPDFDLERLSELDATLQMLRDVGAL